MKCINCGKNSDFRARQGGRCKNCGRPFALEPRRDESVTDLTIQLALRAVSDDGRLRWTLNQLYYDVCRRVRRRRFWHRLGRRRLASVTQGSFGSIFAKWESVHGEQPGRLRGGAFGGDPPATWAAIAELGLDRLLVCETNAIVDVLLANGFHAEQRCAVLSYDGYPHHAYEALRPRLRANPPETVVVAHDASWRGCALATLVADDPRWFGGLSPPTLVDAGLRPADAARFRGLYQSTPHAHEIPTAQVTDEERRFLWTYRLELEAIRPRGLMNVLARVLRGEVGDARERTADEGGTVIWYEEAWGDGDDDVG